MPSLELTRVQFQVLQILRDHPGSALAEISIFSRNRLLKRGLITLGSTIAGVLAAEEAGYLITTTGEQALKNREQVGTRPRGFAAMNAAQRSKIASKGGKRAHALGTAFEFQKGDPRAVAAGKKAASGRAGRVAYKKTQASRDA